jgi:hypothetical protein
VNVAAEGLDYERLEVTGTDDLLNCFELGGDFFSGD